MPRGRKIRRTPTERNFYLVDANFLAAKYIPSAKVTDIRERQRVTRSQDWWTEIDDQVKRRKAVVYAPDICIAEAFKTLAKKYYKDGYFQYPVDYQRARNRFAADIHLTPKTLKASNRFVKFHDISTSRDIIISMDRFYEVFLKHDLNVSAPDLVILATAKYLIDFFNVPHKSLFIVTLDNALWRGTKRIPDVPSAFNPNSPSELASKVFE